MNVDMSAIAERVSVRRTSLVSSATWYRNLTVAAINCRASSPSKLLLQVAAVHNRSTLPRSGLSASSTSVTLNGIIDASRSNFLVAYPQKVP